MGPNLLFGFVIFVINIGRMSSNLKVDQFSESSSSHKLLNISVPKKQGHHNSEGVVWSVQGEDIRMMCTISNLGNRTVSWVRYRDIHLLTHGVQSYTDDKRFSAYMDIDTNTWQLRIKNVSFSDAGFYECQVSTSPPTGQQVKLSVVEPTVSVLGGPDLFINAGSFINLTCSGHNLPGVPEDVYWYHEKQRIEFSGSRGGVSSIVVSGPETVSQLLIQSAMVKDTGIYTCHLHYGHRPDVNNKLRDKINVHVLQGELRAAIQFSPIFRISSYLIAFSIISQLKLR